MLNLIPVLVHGGAVSTLFDATGGFPFVPVSKPGFWETSGVSRSLNVTYLRPIPLGMTILVENELVHAGKKQGMPSLDPSNERP